MPIIRRGNEKINIGGSIFSYRGFTVFVKSIISFDGSNTGSVCVSKNIIKGKI